MQVIISSLSPKQQATLKLCGITQDEQLTRTSPQALARDVETCKEHFPTEACEISLHTLQQICEAARAQSGAACKSAQADVPQPAAKEEESDALFFTRSCPPLIVSKRRRTRSHVAGGTPALPLGASNEDIEKNEIDQFGTGEHTNDKQERIGAAAAYEFHNAVHNTHPVAVYFGAWATILLVLDVCAIIIVPTLIILGFDLNINIKTTGLALAVVCALPYFLLSSRAVCSVCRIRVFSFKKYSHNRQAHWMPLLGCALPTALHVAFRFWFRCPACGTPQKLYRHTRHHH
ncbi:MAG: hypothetical protein IJO34_01860 [Akkermansia sp.]|nr:hypothetical protein [Akkermansia sp.]